jgi:hypothetical protein
MQDQI